MKKLSIFALLFASSFLPAQVQLGKGVQIGWGSGTGVSGGATGQVAQYPADGTTVQGATISGDATLAPGGALTLTTVNSSPGTCGDATHVGQITINGKGLVPSCTPVVIAAGGSSVGAQGTVQVVGATAGSFAAGTPNNINAALGSSNGLNIFADSLGQATGATSTGVGNVAFQNGYSYLLQQDIGGPFLLGGTSGDQEADVNYKWMYRVANPQGNGIDPLYVHELGTNDAIVYMGDTNKQAIFQRLALGSLAWLGVPRTNKIFAQNCTLAGGMAADPAPLLVGLGAKATTSGATASCVINAPKANDTIYACYLIQDANSGTFTLSLDGTPQTDPFNGTTTWNAFGDGGAAINTQNSVKSGVACARFTGVSAGNHTVLFSVTSTTGASNAVWPQWVGAAPVASATLNPTVRAISPNQQNVSSAGAPYVATYAGFISSIVSNLAADGLNESYVDTSNALLNDPSCGNGVQSAMFANCYNDSVHPNNAGYAVIHNTEKAATPSSFLLAVTHWNPQQPGQNYIPAAPLTPYQWFDVNPYNLASATNWNPGIKFQGSNGQFSGISYQGNTGLTFYAPSGVVGFSFCPWGGSGFLGSGPPTSASCFMDIVTNGQVRFFGGSALPNGSSFQSQSFSTGSSVTVTIGGLLKVTGNGLGSLSNGVAATGVANSTTNFQSPCWSFNAGIWNSILGSPGFDGPCLRGVPITPTPAGTTGQVYLTLTAGSVAVGLDLRNTSLLNHLFKADFNTIGGSGTATLTLGTSAQVGTGATGPTCVAGYSCNPVAGTFTFTTGTGTLAAGMFTSLNSNSAQPSCLLNTDSVAYIGANSVATGSVAAFKSAVALTPSTTYTVTYVCMGN